MEELIRLHEISFSYYGKIAALAGVNLAINAGDKMAIIGSNGTGKSTLLQIMAGLLHAEKGEVRFQDRVVSETALQDPAFLRYFRGRVGYLFQD